MDIPPPANAGEDPFDWGSAEFVDGCYRLALAILADAFDDSVAVQDFARFVSGWIVALDDDAWILTVGDLREWIERTRAEEAAGDLDAFKLGGTANGGAR
ncbi:MAG: hypothetical protein KF873_02130 [Gemmataceae bacterium]|nr:hypothetical protein [Gemmataceae bacterium]